MTIVIVGIDASSKKIAAAWTQDNGRPKVEIKTLPTSLEYRCKAAYLWARRFRRRFPDDSITVFIEKPLGGRNIASTIVQAEVQGAIIAGMADPLCKVLQVNVQTWKKVVVGNGGADKPAIKRNLKVIWPYMASLAKDDQDVVDAGSILRYGQLTMKIKDRIDQEIT